MSGIFKFGLVIIVVLAGNPVAKSETRIWFVKSAAAGADTGETWQDAFKELQSALASASSGDEIWVASGTYRPDFDVVGGVHTGDRTMSFDLVDGVAMFGGFVGTEHDRNQRNPSTAITILSGDLGPQELPIRSFHIVTSNDASESTVLDGFTITGGQADGYNNDFAAGMWNQSSDIEVANCKFSKNLALAGATAVLNRLGSPTFRNCEFSSNVGAGAGAVSNSASNASFYGCLFQGNKAIGTAVYAGVAGAVECQGGQIRFEDCDFYANDAYYAGAIDFAVESLVVKNCYFSSNSAVYGGALNGSGNSAVVGSHFLYNSSNGGGAAIRIIQGVVSIDDCFFEYSTAGGLGGAIYNESTTLTVARTTFKNNSAERGGAIYSTLAPLYSYGPNWAVDRSRFNGNIATFGGAIYNDYRNAGIANSSFSGNVSTYGGGLFTRGGSTQINGCSFADNVGASGGAIYSYSGSNIVVRSSILRGNGASGDSPIEPDQFSSPYFDIKFTDIEGGWSGFGNVDLDPQFVRNPNPVDGLWGTFNDDYGDLRLSPSSPVINAGDPSFVPDPGELDLEGHARVLCGRVDMGAYEFGIGDADCNKAIDLTDFTTMNSCIAGPGQTVDFDCVKFDFDGDGDVDLGDFNAFQRAFGG